MKGHQQVMFHVGIEALGQKEEILLHAVVVRGRELLLFGRLQSRSRVRRRLPSSNRSVRLGWSLRQSLSRKDHGNCQDNCYRCDHGSLTVASSVRGLKLTADIGGRHATNACSRPLTPDAALQKRTDSVNLLKPVDTRSSSNNTQEDHAIATIFATESHRFLTERQQGDFWQLGEDGRAAMDVVLLGAAADSELVVNAVDWITSFVEQSAQVRLTVRKGKPAAGSSHLVAVIGNPKRAGLQGLFEAGGPAPEVGPEGFVIQRLSTREQGRLLICWAPTELGCRYGLIEVLRSLRADGRSVGTKLVRVVNRPQFPMRICYVNFAEHLQNAFNPNVLFDVPVNRWSRADWERLHQSHTSTHLPGIGTG